MAANVRTEYFKVRLNEDPQLGVYVQYPRMTRLLMTHYVSYDISHCHTLQAKCTRSNFMIMNHYSKLFLKYTYIFSRFPV